jgi:hypothetical protein
LSCGGLWGSPQLKQYWIKRGPAGEEIETWQLDFKRSAWFTRGWTLQELIAPFYVEFFDREWQLIGSKQMLADTVSAVTKIPKDVLT